MRNSNLISLVLRLLKIYKIPLLLFFTAIAFYWSFAYDLERTDFTKLITLYTSLFFVSFKFVQLLKNQFWILAAAALIFRLVFILALPNLSQDFYRFIWDGRLLANGINPYLSTPQQIIADTSSLIIPQAAEMVKGMGSLSASNFTNYPPLNQLFFLITGWIATKNVYFSVLILRIIILFAEFGILFFGRRLLKNLHLPEHQIFWFLLNPFVIIECTGNLHFESVMGFFILLAFYFLHKQKWLIAAILLGLSIAVKLLPLMFLPVFLKFFSDKRSIQNNQNCDFKQRFLNVINDFRSIKWTRLLGFYVMVIACVLLSFLPFINKEFIANFSDSVLLWFQKFEFNASVYYLVRWIGFQIKGFNIIADAGKILPLFSFMIILGIGLFRKNNSLKSLILGCLFSISTYFLLSTTVHPWYIITPLLLCTFTKYRFPIVWSLMSMLSYSAYGNELFEENLWLVILEYLVVISYAVAELFGKEKQERPLFL